MSARTPKSQTLLHARTIAALALMTGLVWSSRCHARDEMEVCASAAESAQSHRRAKRLLAARADILVCAREVCPSVVRADCLAWLGEVIEALPSVIVAARQDGGADLVDVRVLVDGVSFLASIDGRAVPIDPGVHTFRFEAKGREPQEMIFVIRESEKNRVLQITFPPVRQAPAEPHASRRSTGGRTTGLVAMGIGVVALAGWGYFGLSSLSDYHRLEDTCGTSASCARSDVTEARTKMIVADISFGVGVAASVVAVWQLLLRAPSVGSTRVAFHPTAGGGVAALGGRF